MEKLLKKGICKGELILVNREFGIKDADSIPLAEVATGVFLQPRAALMLGEALKEINAGTEIAFVSGFRSRREQNEIYKMSLSENGEEFTKQYVALPDHSEHQTGLAIDLGLNSENIDFLCPDFPDRGKCGEFGKTAARYGFIRRYSKEKEEVTGISCEPWHFRFVGTPHAEIMEKKGLVLEEYIDYIKNYSENERLKIGGDEIYFIKAEMNSEETAFSLSESEKERCVVSGNNVDGFIITIKGK